MKTNTKRRRIPGRLALATTALALTAPALASATDVANFRRRADDWLLAAPDHDAFAFDEFYPGITNGTGCLVPPPETEPVVIVLPNGTITVSRFDGGGAPDCAIQDGNSQSNRRVSDGWVDGPNDRLVMEFDPPISALQTFWGSLDEGRRGTMEIYAGGLLVDTITSAASPVPAWSTGHGFVSPILIDRVELLTAENGGTAVGAFTSYAVGEPGLGTVNIPGYGGPDGDDVALDVACVFVPADERDRVFNVNQATWHYSVTDAIECAVNGDEIVLGIGVYHETIDLGGKAITLRSTDPGDPLVVEDTIIEASGFQQTAVTIASGEGPGTVIDGISITEGFGTNGVGGGLSIIASSPTLTRCYIQTNFATDDGGGAFIDAGAAPTFTDCRFVGNGTDQRGGAIRSRASDPLFTNCSFEANAAGNRGGAMYFSDILTPYTLSGCTFTGNAGGLGGGVSALEVAAFIVSDCLFTGNLATDGGGVFGEASLLFIDRCDFIGNTVTQRGAAVRVGNAQAETSEVTDCRFYGNVAPYEATAGSAGSGTVFFAFTRGLVHQCLFSGNRGSGIVGEGAEIDVRRTTIYGGTGAALVSASGIITARNSILWGNESPQTQHGPDGQVLWSFCNVADTGGASGQEANLDADPQFADPDGADDLVGTPDDDLHLIDGSPCLGAGDTELDPGDPQQDLDGGPRHYGFIDLGPYELGVDCDGSGVEDWLEIEQGILEDCNGNLEYDGCEYRLDCDGNGVLDICDILAGTLSDTNGNGIADECEISGSVGDTTWVVDVDYPIFVATQDMLVTGTLDIEPGVQVWFVQGVTMTVFPGAEVNVNGVPENPALFSSTAVRPAGGDWGGLRFAAGSRGTVRHAIIEYAQTYGVRAEDADLTVEDTLVRHIGGVNQPRGTIDDPALGGGPAYGIYVTGDVQPMIRRNSVTEVRGGRGGQGASGAAGTTGAYGERATDCGENGGDGLPGVSAGDPGAPGAPGGLAVGIYLGAETFGTVIDNVVTEVIGGTGGGGGGGGTGGTGGDGAPGRYYCFRRPISTDGGDGGQGGSGLSGGTGGHGGLGGTAHGILIDDVLDVELLQNLVTSVRGGTGGRGGYGGLGGRGGGGGEGGLGFTTGDPGAGGDSGDSGRGGDGGPAGRGGIGTGIAVSTPALTLISIPHNVVAHLRNGTGGVGGEGGNPGDAGEPGQGGFGWKRCGPAKLFLHCPTFGDDGSAGNPNDEGFHGGNGGLGPIVALEAGGDAQLVVDNVILTTADFEESIGVTAPGDAGLVINDALLFNFDEPFGPGTTNQGLGLIFDDPQFVDPDAGDFHLAPTSPAIDTGDNADVPPGLTADLDGNARIVDGGSGTATVDLGVYELQGSSCPEDIDGSGAVDFGDILAILAAWGNVGGPEDIDGSGTVDFGDLLAVLGAWGACD